MFLLPSSESWWSDEREATAICRGVRRRSKCDRGGKGGGTVAVGEMGDGSSDVVIYVPQMLREEDCQATEKGEDGQRNNDPMG